MDANVAAFFTTALITIAALLPITNPPGNAPIFLSLTRELADAERDQAEVAGHAFYPLAFPLTVGPGSISIAITLGAGLPSRGMPALVTAAGSVAGLVTVSLAIYLAYRFAPRMVRLLGETGTAVFLRLSAFILLCIGVQICWEGLNELLTPWKPGPR